MYLLEEEAVTQTYAWVAPFSGIKDMWIYNQNWVPH